MRVTYVDHMGSDLSVVNAARVSFKKKHEEFKEKDKKLLKYLAEHGHISPFHHTFITMHVKAPVFVARQLVKHEYMPWNEVSRRYVDEEPEFYSPNVWRGRSKDKKQGSSGPIDVSNFGTAYSILRQNTIPHAEDRFYTHALDFYSDLLDHGVAPEQARIVLPQSMFTEWYWSGTLSAWAKMYNLRIKEDTQYETREVAKQAGEILSGLYPESWAALRNA